MEGVRAHLSHELACAYTYDSVFSLICLLHAHSITLGEQRVAAPTCAATSRAAHSSHATRRVDERTSVLRLPATSARARSASDACWVRSCVCICSPLPRGVRVGALWGVCVWTALHGRAPSPIRTGSGLKWCRRDMEVLVCPIFFFANAGEPSTTDFARNVPKSPKFFLCFSRRCGK